MNPFLDHPRSRGVTYFQHFAFAFRWGWSFLLIGSRLILHAFVPAIQSNVSPVLQRFLEERYSEEGE
jgi:hypothetical protein